MKTPSILLWVFGLVTSLTLFAADTPPEEITFEKIIKATLANNGQIQEAVQDIEIARAQLEQARSAIFPKGNVLVIGAPIFEETGNALKSTSNWKKWGPLVKGSVELVEPLYSFGMIGNYKKAAENQLIARENLADAKRNDVVSNLKEIYYGYLMANDLDKLLDDLTSFLEEAVKTAEESTKKKSKSNVKPHDVFRLKTALDDLRQKKLYAKQAKQTAERAVNWMSGLNAAKIPASTLTAETYDKKPLEEYLKRAKDKRPEYKALTSGYEARKAYADAKRAQSYPVLFVGGFGALNWSPVRAKQDSVFANDPFNSLQGGIGLGFKVDIDWSKHSAEAQEQNAEAMKLKATESWAGPGIELQVKKAFWELEQAQEGLTVAERRKAIAKKWFVQSAMGWSIGITPAKDLMEALEGDGLAKKNYIETVYSLNLALAKLSQAVGEEVTALKYR